MMDFLTVFSSWTLFHPASAIFGLAMGIFAYMFVDIWKTHTRWHGWQPLIARVVLCLLATVMIMPFTSPALDSEVNLWKAISTVLVWSIIVSPIINHLFVLLSALAQSFWTWAGESRAFSFSEFRGNAEE